MKSDFLRRLGMTDRDLILALLGASFIVDVGVISAVNGNLVDVQHAIQPRSGGEQLESTETKGVELLWPYPVQWDVQAGDAVLLLGLKDYVRTVSGLQPGPTDVTLHYTQETMKAVPFGTYNPGARKVYLNGKSKEFVTWDELNSALQGFVAVFNAHVHASGGTGTPVTPASLDISASKTTTVLTGG